MSHFIMLCFLFLCLYVTQCVLIVEVSELWLTFIYL